MNMNKIYLASLFLLSACTTREGLYGVLSSRPMSLYTLTEQAQTVASQVHAEVSYTQFLLIPLDDAPKIDNAIEELVQKYQGDYMSNIEIKYHTVRLLPFYGKSTWSVTGDIMRVSQ